MANGRILSAATVVVAVVVVLFTNWSKLYEAYLFPIISPLLDIIQANQFLQTVLFGSASASIAYSMSRVYNMVVTMIYGMFRSDVTWRNTDANYDAILDYVTEKFLMTKEGATSNMQVQTKKKKMSWQERRDEWMGLGVRAVPKLEMKPNDDSFVHSFTYKNHNILFYRKKGETMTVGYDHQPHTIESMTFSLWGTDKSILMDLFYEAIAAASVKNDEGITVYVYASNWYGSWEKALVKKARDRSSVILDVDDADSLLNDAKRFLESAQWYSSMGIPYRRGYLLHGPPGCGKTSFAQVMAGELKKDICMLNLSHEGLRDDSLAESLREAPKNAIILLEDVDAIFVDGKAEDNDGHNNKRKSSKGVSFSGLLNALDGVAAQEGRIFFMTTNHLDKLDAALIRPGRCDFKLEVRKASKLQIERMFLRFFPGEIDRAQSFAMSLPADEMSMAQLQGHFLEHASSAQECIQYIPELLHQTRPKIIKHTNIYEHLRRVGLDSYAAVFEFLNVQYAMDINSGNGNDLLKSAIALCPCLRFDFDGRKRLSALFERKDDFMEFEYAIADLASMRDMFLSAYPTKYEREHKEKSSFLRRQNSGSSVVSGTPGNGNGTAGADILSPVALKRSNSAGSSVFDDGEDVDEGDVSIVDALLEQYGSRYNSDGSENVWYFARSNSLSAFVLHKLSRRLAEILSTSGKGIVSFYQMRELLASFPDRPVQCVAAAYMMKEAHKEGARSQISRSAPAMTLRDVLKRGCVMADFYKIKPLLLRGVDPSVQIRTLAGEPPPPSPPLRRAPTPTPFPVDAGAETGSDADYGSGANAGVHVVSAATPAVSGDGNVVLNKDSTDDEVQNATTTSTTSTTTTSTSTSTSVCTALLDPSWEVNALVRQFAVAADGFAPAWQSTSLFKEILGDVNLQAPTRNTINFTLLTKPRIIKEFVSFYSNTSTNSASATKEVDLEIMGYKLATLICMGDFTSVTLSVAPSSDAQSTVETRTTKLPTADSIPLLSCISCPCRERISLSELLNHFHTHSSSPATAVDRVADIFVFCMPAVPPKVVPPPATEWVYSWLAAGETGGVIVAPATVCNANNASTASSAARVATASDDRSSQEDTETSAAAAAATVVPIGEASDSMMRYGKNFVAAGLSTEADLAFGDVLSESDLKDMGVKLLGHIRKIVRMHQKLLDRHAQGKRKEENDEEKK